MSRQRRRRKPRSIKLETLLKLKSRAEIESLKDGTATLYGGAEDAGQEYVLRLLEGKHRRATVSQAMVDMSREIIGRKGQPKFEAAKAVATAFPTDPELIRTSQRPFDVVNRRLFLEKAMNSLTRKEKVFILAFLDGNNLREIGDLMGFTASRASQIWDEIITKMKIVAED
jgi:DNA-directed RNA polymerase specialized sigma24 family protein